MIIISLLLIGNVRIIFGNKMIIISLLLKLQSTSKTTKVSVAFII